MPESIAIEALESAAEGVELVAERIRKLERRQQKRLDRAKDELLVICQQNLPRIISTDEAKKLLRVMPWYSAARTAVEARLCELYLSELDAALAVHVIRFFREDAEKVFMPLAHQRSEFFEKISKAATANTIKLFEQRILATTCLADVYLVWEEVYTQHPRYCEEECIQRVFFFIPPEQLTRRKMSMKRFAQLCGQRTKDWPMHRLYEEVMNK